MVDEQELAVVDGRRIAVTAERDPAALDCFNLFSDTLAWVQEHLDEVVTVEDLAARSAMSPRTFARRFLATTGTTPYQWLVGQRVQLARRLLEMSELPIEIVA